MTRARQLKGSYWSARAVGAQFAAGHSLVILLAAVLLHGQRTALPAWLDGLGFFISTTFLLVIAATNLTYALRPASGATPRLGPVAALLMRAAGRQPPPLLVGMAFALSFDAFAQAAFFASHAGGNGDGGLGAVVAMAGIFGAGMLLADAGNGALLNWFAGMSDRLAQHASRFSSGFIAAIALLTAAAGILRHSQQGFAEVWESFGVWIGVGVVACTSAVYLVRIAVQRARLAAEPARSCLR
jgi:high-affinity nickel-transport protein